MTLSKFESVVVCLGAILGIFVSLLDASAYYLALWARPDAPALILGVQSLVAPLLSFEDVASVYRLYGRLFVFVFLALVIGVTALRARRGTTLSKVERWGYDLVRFGLWASAVGCFADFWLGISVLGEFTQTLFLLGTIGGAILYAVGSLLLVVAWMRDGMVPRALTIAWALVVPLGVLFLFVLIKHIPGAFALAMSLSWLVTVAVWGATVSPALMVSRESGGA